MDFLFDLFLFDDVVGVLIILSFGVFCDGEFVDGGVF